MSKALTVFTQNFLLRDPAFQGATVKGITTHHPESPDYNPDHIRGVHVTFRNGMVLSIQWGYRNNYSNVGRGFWKPGEEPTFETAAWYRDEDGDCEEWYIPEIDGPWTDWEDMGERGVYDQVQAYQSLAEVIETARKVANHDPAHWHGEKA